MDQSIISGIGNYLRADILYEAQIDPRKTISELTEKEIQNLFTSAYTTVWRSYRAKTSKKNIEEGRARDSYRYIIYGQKKCPRGYPVVTFEDKNKRTMWWVPDVQK
jgi:formamidopyrimidine-DNA glycosylase